MQKDTISFHNIICPGLVNSIKGKDFGAILKTILLPSFSTWVMFLSFHIDP